ncbi:hypothetical protein HALA3H3_p10039 [Halomonas sp. A3H3]|nr:hypothetical protein HALA3H3_p10039 [Halomonas sp. A3H3]
MPPGLRLALSVRERQQPGPVRTKCLWGEFRVLDRARLGISRPASYSGRGAAHVLFVLQAAVPKHGHHSAALQPSQNEVHAGEIAG